MEWFIYILLIFILWTIYVSILFFYQKKSNLKVTNYDTLMTVHYNCFSFNARYIYLIKLFYGKSRRKFFFLTTFLLEFIDEKGITFLSVKIPPTVLFQSQKEGFREGDKGREKLLAFLLQTKISLTSAVSIRISHDCKAGDLLIYYIQIIDLISRETYISRIQKFIQFLPTGSQPNAQVFGMNFSGINRTDIKPSSNLNIPEMALFFIAGLHWILFHTQYLITSFDKGLTKSYDNNNTTMVLTALLSALTAFLVVIAIAILYYSVIKRTYAAGKGIGLIWSVRFSFLLFVVVMSIVFGFIAAFKTENTSNQLKWFSTIIAYVIYTLAFFSLVLCCHSSAVVKASTDYELRSEEDKSFKSVKTNPKSEKKSDSNRSIRGVVISSSDTPRTEKNLGDTKGSTTKLKANSNFKTNP